MQESRTGIGGQSKKMRFPEARDMLLEHIEPVATEKVSLEELWGRVIAEDVSARMNVPHYERSPLDGYAVRSSDTSSATENSPVALKIACEIKAGDAADRLLKSGEAAKILTGAPIPDGADAVVKYEETLYTADSVTVLRPLSAGENIIRIGEDVKTGDTLVGGGTVADTAVLGLLASQGIAEVEVYRRPDVAVVSTGNEIAEVGAELSGSRIYNSNRYMLAAELERCGCRAVYEGCAGDDMSGISRLLSRVLSSYDAVVITGGVSAGDYDLVPEALENAGVDILVHGVKMKPGMACVYGMYRSKPVIALSGNPASAITNFYCIGRCVLRKYSGAADYVPETVQIRMLGEFSKKSGGDRILRGQMKVENGMICMDPSPDQGNVVIRSLRAANLLAVVPMERGPVAAGDVLDGFMI